MQISDSTYKPISYQGHGMIEKTASHAATAHVVNHELHHLNQFRAKALNSGKEIFSEDITLIYQFVDGKLIPVHGRAETVMAEKQDTDSALISQTISGQTENSQNMEEAANTGSEQAPEDKLRQIEQRLQTQLEQIKSKINALEQNKDNSFKLTNLQNREKQLEQVISKLQGLKSKLNMENLNKIQDELLDQMETSFMSPEKLLEAIMGVKTGEQDSESQPGQSLSEGQKQDYNRSLQYSLQALAMSAGWMA